MKFFILAVIFVIVISGLSYLNERRRIFSLDQVTRKILGNINFVDEKNKIYNLYLKSKPHPQPEIIHDFVVIIKKSDNYCPLCTSQSLSIQIGKHGRYYGCLNIDCNFTRDFQK